MEGLDIDPSSIVVRGPMIESGVLGMVSRVGFAKISVYSRTYFLFTFFFEILHKTPTTTRTYVYSFVNLHKQSQSLCVCVHMGCVERVRKFVSVFAAFPIHYMNSDLTFNLIASLIFTFDRNGLEHMRNVFLSCTLV